MRLVPEYEPVQRLYLCFVQAFFNTRFDYGKTLCQIIAAARPFVDVELFVSAADLGFIQEECAHIQMNLENVRINYDSPGRAILAEYMPIFAADDAGQGVGLIFSNPFMENIAELRQFSERFVHRLDFCLQDIGFDFATAHLAVNEDIVLLSDCFFKGPDRESKLQFFSDHFPSQSFHVVPSLAGDVTNDLDMYLWPIAPKAWIVSEYPAYTPQADSIEPALRLLKDVNHTIHRVPGLEPIIYEDINTLPNYANGVIINGAALVPAYQRREDEIIEGILKDYGYRVWPIDCSKVILSNSAIHCISKTVPNNSGLG